MRLKINGAVRQFPGDLMLPALLEKLQLPAARVAVERNRTLVHRDKYSSVRLEDGDELEIVQLVGGG